MHLSAAPVDRARPRLWIPRQHGAWAMLAVPILLGIAAAGFAPLQLLLVVTAVAGYLLVATTQAWLRARRRPSYGPSLAVYGVVAAVPAVLLVAVHPVLLASLIVLLPAAAITIAGARPGTPRELAASLAQVAFAAVLVPATALLAGPVDVRVVALATGLAGAELAGSVLVVRSVIRERDNAAFALLSAAFHLCLIAPAAVLLPGAYAILSAVLAARAVALPVVRRRRAAAGRPLRPVQVGMVELAASVALVALAFAVPF